MKINLESLLDLKNIKAVNGWYEVHLTVLCDLTNIEDFKKLCKLINSKAIVIDLTNGENQVMNSKTIKCTPIELFDIISQDIKVLSKNFKITRVKVECSPFNDILNNVNEKYIETHLPCLNITNDIVKNLKLKHYYHTSKNYFKEDIRMITVRTSHLSHKDFKNLLDLDVDVLVNENLLFGIYKEDIEFCILDTNPMIDNNWIKGEA